MKSVIIILLVVSNLFFTKAAISQNNFDKLGARSRAVSGASVTYKDVWSQYHNQAALAYLKGVNIGFAYQNEFLMQEYSTRAIAAALPIKSGTFGLNYANFGYNKYSENKIGLAFSKVLGKRISAGIQIDYLYTHIEGEYGENGNVLGEIGILTEPVDNLTIGAHLYNVWRSELSSFENEYIPTIFKIGSSYRLYQISLLSIEFEKNLDLAPVFKFGVELEPVKNFTFTAGIATNPNSFSFGFGYQYRRMILDMAFSKHPVLGYSTGISIAYAFKDRL
jgi:hypothetical protein